MGFVVCFGEFVQYKKELNDCGLVCWLQKEGNLDEPKPKRIREEAADGDGDGVSSPYTATAPPKRIQTGIFSTIPPELFPHILKFLSSEVSPLPFLLSPLTLIHAFSYSFNF